MNLDGTMTSAASAAAAAFAGDGQRPDDERRLPWHGHCSLELPSIR